jgi:hypothetical protein
MIEKDVHAVPGDHELEVIPAFEHGSAGLVLWIACVTAMVPKKLVRNVISIASRLLDDGGPHPDGDGDGADAPALRDTSRNGNLCTFAESRCNVLNRLAGQRQRIAPCPRTALKRS